jgi:putative oxidoreductase
MTMNVQNMAAQPAAMPMFGLSAKWQTGLFWFQSLAMLGLRIALGLPFIRSGLNKWDGFLSLSPSTLYLFENEFKLHIFGGEYPFPAPDVMAFLSAAGETVFPILLFVGLASRFAALGILGMAMVIQLTYPSHWLAEALPWSMMALVIMSHGPGRIALDRFVAKLFAR